MEPEMEPFSDSGVDIAPLAPPEPERPNRLPLIAVGIAVLLIAGLLGVVLLSRDNRSPEERLAAAREAVADAETFRLEMTSTQTSGPITFNLAITGAVDVERQAATMNLRVGAVNLDMAAQGTAAFLRLPAGAAAQYGKQWARLDDPGSLFGQSGSGAAFTTTNPLDQLKQLDYVTGPVEEVGEEEIRGIDTTHFRTTLDMSRALPAEMTANMPAEARTALESLTNVPYDVWLDDDDRPVRQKFSFDIPAGLLGTSTKSDTTVDMYDFGADDIDVQVPGPDESITLSQAQLGQAFAALLGS